MRGNPQPTSVEPTSAEPAMGSPLAQFAGSRHHARPFPADAAMLKFYYALAPNPMKVALFLEEAGLPYEPIPVDTRKGEQHALAFRRSIRTARCR